MDSEDSDDLNHTMKKIGVIAGNGSFPLVFIKEAVKQGYHVSTIAFRGEGDEALASLSHNFTWLYLGQVKKLINFFKRSGVDTAVMLGGIQKTRMFIDIRPDTLAIRAMARMRHSHDDGVLRMFADLLKDYGISIVHSTSLLPELLSPPGIWTKALPSPADIMDIEIGWEVTRRIGELDVGQCVVVGGGSVLAVEAIDGTDATIRRGGDLGKGEVVVVKLAKPGQDMRFDIPAVGPETIKVMSESGARVLALEAYKTLALDREELIKRADKLGICVLSIAEPEDLSLLLSKKKRGI